MQKCIILQMVIWVPTSITRSDQNLEILVGIAGRTAHRNEQMVLP